MTVHSIDLPRALCGMARLARVVIPGHPHDVAQRGNGRQRAGGRTRLTPCAPRRALVGRSVTTAFFTRLERETRRILKPGKRGPKPSADEED